MTGNTAATTTTTTTTFNVLVYNIFSPVPEPLRFYGQKERSVRVKDVLRQLDQQHDLDVVILDEVIAPETQSVIFTDLPTLGFKYKTKKITEVFSVNGGVVVFSKHPITQEACTVFGDRCVGIDCFAAKGVSYARVCKNGMYFNVFGTHLQAWPGVRAHATRVQQIDQTQRFLQQLQIPEDEPVLFAGDLNTDLFLDRDYIQHLSFTLGMEVPELHPDSHPFTVDPQHNKLVGNDDPSEYTSDDWPHGCVEEYYRTLSCPCCPAQWLDYTLYSKRHLQPVHADMRALPVKVPPFRIKVNATQEAEVEDVSDHFPVLGHFVFDTRLKSEAHARVGAAVPLRLTHGTNSHVVTVAIVIAVIGVLVLILGWWAVRRASRRHRSHQSSAFNAVTPSTLDG